MEDDMRLLTSFLIVTTVMVGFAVKAVSWSSRTGMPGTKSTVSIQELHENYLVTGKLPVQEIPAP